jgi:hypothetical protein
MRRTSIDGIPADERRHNTFTYDDCDLSVTTEEIVEMLRAIEEARVIFDDWLLRSYEFKNSWDVFTRAGGVSADDFEQFMKGTFRSRRIRQKRHLRLVSNQPKRSVLLRRRGGNDAA